MGKLEKAGFSVDEISHIYEVPFRLILDVRMSVLQFCCIFINLQKNFDSLEELKKAVKTLVALVVITNCQFF